MLRESSPPGCRCVQGSHTLGPVTFGSVVVAETVSRVGTHGFQYRPELVPSMGAGGTHGFRTGGWPAEAGCQAAEAWHWKTPKSRSTQTRTLPEGVAFLLGSGCPGDVLLAPHRQRRGPAGLGAVHPTEVARGRGLPRAVSEAGGTAAAGAAPSAYMAPGSRCLTHEELPTARSVGRRTGGPCRAPAWGERGAAALERRGWAGVSPIGNPRVPATDRLGPPGPSC